MYKLFAASTNAPSAPDPGNSPPQDVDAWNISVSPQHLLSISSGCATLQLVDYAPTISDVEEYGDWVYVAHASAYYKIAPQFKEPLFQLMKQHVAIYASTYPTSFIKGRQAMTHAQLVHFLQQVGCGTVRVQAFGMKCPLHMLASQEPADETTLQKNNTWDLGRFYMTNSISLFTMADTHLPRHKGTKYPMLTPLGEEHGSLKFYIDFKGQKVLVKIYSRVVHTIKAVAPYMGKMDAKTVKALRARMNQLENVLEAYQEADEQTLGGFRMEVTIRAPTLRAAVELVTDSPLLTIGEYLHPTTELTQDYQIRQKTCTKAELIANCTRLLEAGKASNLFQGRDSGKVGAVEQQKITDIQCALGWSPGQKKPTPSKTPNPWWIMAEAVPDGPLPEVRIARNKDEYKRFFDAIKDYLPCLDCGQKASASSPAFIKDGGDRQYRIACKGCNTKRGIDASKVYFEHVIALGKIPVEVLRPWGITLGTLAESETESEEDDAPAPAKRPRILAKETQVPQQRSLTAAPVRSKVRAENLKPIANFRQGGEVSSVMPGITVSSCIVGDGNCQFAALALHIFGDQRRHQEVRRTAVATIGKNKELLNWCAQGEGHEGRVTYLREMSRTGVWGDEISLWAICKAYKVAVMVITLERGVPHCSIYPANTNPPYMGLFFSAQRKHYEVAYPTPPAP